MKNETSKKAQAITSKPLLPAVLEYKFIEEYSDGDDEGLFNSLGKNGWELVSYVEQKAEEDSGYEEKYRAIFKRRVALKNGG